MSDYTPELNAKLYGELAHYPVIEHDGVWIEDTADKTSWSPVPNLLTDGWPLWVIRKMRTRGYELDVEDCGFFWTIRWDTDEEAGEQFQPRGDVEFGEAICLAAARALT